MHAVEIADRDDATGEGGRQVGEIERLKRRKAGAGWHRGVIVHR
jgi:hypothetical protein